MSTNEDLLIAGLLHDIIEDTSVTKELLASKFGSEVAELVSSATEINKSLPWKERKNSMILKIKDYSRDGALLKSADSLQNLSSLRYGVENDTSILDNFSVDIKTKIRNEVRKLSEFKKYHPTLPFYSDWSDHLEYLDRIVNKASKKV